MRASFLALAIAVIVCSCGGGSSSETVTSIPAGSIGTKPGASAPLHRYIAEDHRSGTASDFRVIAVRWGRLVDLYELDPASGARTIVFQDLVVDPTIVSDGVDFELSRSPFDGAEEMTILHPFGSAEWEPAFRRLEQGLQDVLDRGVGANVLPPFTALPRNGALVVLFDDLLDASLVDERTILVRTGYPAKTPYEARVFADPNHGGVVNGAFHSTRAVVDMTIDEAESQALGLPANAVGLPPALGTGQANVVVRIPTRPAPSAGVLVTLQNLSQHPTSFTGGGPVDPTSPSLDVVRAFRSGGPASATGDPHNGFLRDDTPPRLIGVQSVAITSVNPAGPGTVAVDLSFADPACALAPRTGDVLVLASGTPAEVEGTSPPPVGGVASAVTVRPLAGGTVTTGIGELRAIFGPGRGAPSSCFVSISPDPVGLLRLIDPAASLELTFDEPMDPDSIDPFETVTLTDPAASGALDRLVVAHVTANVGATEFAVDAAVPLRHATGQRETYVLDVVGGSAGVTDLAGNAVADLPGPIALTVDDTAPSFDTGGISLRFASVDENGDGVPELRGQLVYALTEGEVRSRAVTRFTREVNDSAAAAPTAMTMVPFGGRPDPLSPYGSKVQAVWRYHDLGMTLLDENEHNVDVEGLYWEPASGGINVNNFPEFQIALAHSKYLPDESFTPPSAPFYPTSGLTTDYTDNLLDPVRDPLTVVHARHEGYLLQPVDAVQSAGGRVMAPYPLNRNKAPSGFRYWTWRDTSIQAVGGPFGQGVDTKRLLDLGFGTASVYGAGAVPTIGLPLLMELRAYPRSEILGESPAMMALASPVGVPFFRAWSTGFVTQAGIPQLVDPDVLNTAIGGVDGAQNPIPGTDIGVYYGQADFVTRVSRAHTIWLDTGAPSQFIDPVLDQQLPTDTGVTLAFRGAIALNDPTGAALDARNYDPYGDPLGAFGVNYLNQDTSWKASLSDVDGARFVQVRISLVANAESGVVPRLSALALPFFR